LRAGRHATGMLSARARSALTDRSKDEETAAAIWRGQLLSARKGVHRRAGSRTPGVTPAWLRTPSHHGGMRAPSQSARPPKHCMKDVILSTDYPHTLHPLTPHAMQLEDCWAPKDRVSQSAAQGAAIIALKGTIGADSAPEAHKAHDVPHRGYQWVPTQVREHSFTAEFSPDGTYFNGTFVNTLTSQIDVDDAMWHDIPVPMPRYGQAAFRARQPLRCCLVNEDYVFCRGLAVGVVTEDNQLEDGGVPMCCLPDGMRPRDTLRFAAWARDIMHDGAAAQLVMLDARPDGWIRCFGKSGVKCAIDLSAVRFSISPGLSLIDSVRFHALNVGSRRMVMLQGVLDPRALSSGPALLAPLKPGLRPCRATPFVATGSRWGRFHLMLVRPTKGRRSGGDLVWCDSKWQGTDEVSLSGIFYDVDPEELRFPLELESWTPNKRTLVVADFHTILHARYGNLKCAWRKAFNLEGLDEIDFGAFSAGCKSAGYAGDAVRLWAMLDPGHCGRIGFDEFAVEPEDFEVSHLFAHTPSVASRESRSWRR